MASITGKNIVLRTLEPPDLEFLFNLENDKRFWSVSNTYSPYSKEVLSNYIQNAKQDIFDAKQYRFVICDMNKVQVGLIDLFDFDPGHNRVGIGIIVLPEFQNKGLGSEALKLVIDYAFGNLNVHQLFANITSNNQHSLRLFKKFEFIETGCKQDGHLINGKYEDEYLFQLLNPRHES